MTSPTYRAKFAAYVTEQLEEHGAGECKTCKGLRYVGCACALVTVDECETSCDYRPCPECNND